MNVSRMKKPELIAELEKRSLPTNGLKDELKFRLIEAIEKEKGNDVINVDDSDESPDEVQSVNIDGEIDKDSIVEDDRDDVDINEETLKEDEIIGTDQSTVLTVEDAIKMKTPHEIESESMIVNINEDDDNDSMSNSANEDNVNSLQAINSNNRELDNGDHEIIEISEEVVIDDEDNQENDNNYNDLSSDSNQPQSRDMENEMEKIDSRKEDQMKNQSKTEIWVTNIAEDVKAVELKELFGKYGKVVSAKVVMNAKNPTGNCFGCIQLASANDVKACVMNLDQKEFRGNIITITNDMNDKSASKESIIRNISPVSSSASWGSKNKSGERKLSKSPLDSTAPSSYNKTRNDLIDKDRRPPYREKPSSGGGFYKSKDFSDRGSINRRGNRPQCNDDRRQNYSERSGGKQQHYKGSNNMSYNSTGGNSYTDSRNRDSYQKSTRDTRDNYNTHSYESRYVSSSRDKPPGRSEYGGDRVNKAPTNYNDIRSRSNKYENYDDYVRRDKRSLYDRPVSREIDNYSSSNKRDAYKRPRPEDSDDYLHSKKRRSDIIDERPHHYRNIESPKKYYPEKEYRKVDYKCRRDDYPSDHPSKTDRDYFPARRNVDYSVRRDGYDGYSPERHAASRSNHYSKDSYVPHSTDFGGRSRRY